MRLESGSSRIMPLPVQTVVPGLQVAMATTRRELAAYADRWNELLADSRAASVFLTWQWIDTWLDVVHPTARLMTVVVSDLRGRLVGIAPFYLSSLQLLGHVPYGCLRILGDRHAGAEYPDLILRRGYEARAMHSILRTLLSHCPDWHCIWIAKMAGWTGTHEFLREACRRLGFSLRQRPVEFATMDLPATYDAWLEGLSRNRRSYLRRKTRRLLESHQVEHLWPRDPADLPELLEALFELHQKHWRSVGLNGSFEREPHKKPFYHRIAAEAFRQGWLQLDALRVDGQIKAVQYGYLYNGTVASVQEGYDPEGFDGIGNVLRYLAVQRAIAAGVREYDFLAGYSEHKQRWGGQRRLGLDLLIGRPCLRNRLLFAQPVWPTGRFLRQAVPV